MPIFRAGMPAQISESPTDFVTAAPAPMIAKRLIEYHGRGIRQASSQFCGRSQVDGGRATDTKRRFRNSNAGWARSTRILGKWNGGFHPSGI